MCKTPITLPPTFYTATVQTVLPGKAVVTAAGVGTVTATTRAVVYQGARVSLVREEQGGWRVA